MAYGSGLENHRMATYREFESLILRKILSSMTLYELYAQKKDPYSGWPKGLERIKVYTVKENALAYKKKWEEKWQYNNKHCITKDLDTWSNGSELILKTVETDD